MKHKFTRSELKAYDIMHTAKGLSLRTDFSINDIRKEIDEFMLICEQIKNERAVAAIL